MPGDFAILLLLTAVVAGATILRAVWKPERLPQLPVVAAAMWLYFYVFMAYAVAVEMGPLLPSGALALGQLIALASLVGLIVGSRLGMRRPGAASGTQVPQYAWGRLWWIGATLTVLGSVAHLAFITQKQIRWQETTAYWYLAFYVIYPGLACCLVARIKGSISHPAERPAVWALAAFAMFPHVAAARRGPLFPIVMVLVFLPNLVRRRTPKRTVILGALAGSAIVMLLFVAVRPWVYRSGESSLTAISAGDWSEALDSVSFEDVVLRKTRQETDNEFLYHCAMVKTNVETGVYQYGTGYLSLLTHWIPRRWWPSKPELGEGWFGNILHLIPTVTGWRMSIGASAGGLAEVFNQFGWFSPLFWGLLGWLAARMLRRARVEDDPRWVVAYIGVLCASHWLISQGFAAAFVPACVFQVVPWLAFRVVRVAPRKLMSREPPVGA